MPGISVEFAGEDGEEDVAVEDDEILEYRESEASFMTMLFSVSLLALSPLQRWLDSD